MRVVEAPHPETVDWPALLAFIHEAFAYMNGRIDPPSSLHRLSANDLAGKAMQEVLLLVREGEDLESNLLGCMFCRQEGMRLYIGKLAVAHSNRGQGIGRLLLRHAHRLAKRKGCKLLELEARVELVENHKTFERWGFVKTSENAHAGYPSPTSITMQSPVW